MAGMPAIRTGVVMIGGTSGICGAQQKRPCLVCECCQKPYLTQGDKQWADKGEGSAVLCNALCQEHYAC